MMPTVEEAIPVRDTATLPVPSLLLLCPKSRLPFSWVTHVISMAFHTMSEPARHKASRLDHQAFLAPTQRTLNRTATQLILTAAMAMMPMFIKDMAQSMAAKPSHLSTASFLQALQEVEEALAAEDRVVVEDQVAEVLAAVLALQSMDNAAALAGLGLLAAPVEAPARPPTLITHNVCKGKVYPGYLSDA